MFGESAVVGRNAVTAGDANITKLAEPTPTTQRQAFNLINTTIPTKLM